MSDPIDITIEQLEKLRHALGLNYDAEPTRNYFHSGAEGQDADLMALKEAGLMYVRPAPAFCEDGDVVYHATDAGKAYALERQSVQSKPKKTVWQQFMDSDMSRFTDFLDIEAPRYETRSGRVKEPDDALGLSPTQLHMLPYRQFYRMISPRGTGAWCDTMKAAKASYKADMRARKAAEKAEAASNETIAISA